MLANICRDSMLPLDWNTIVFNNLNCVEFNTLKQVLFAKYSNGTMTNGNAATSDIPFDVAGETGGVNNTVGTIGFWFKWNITSLQNTVWYGSVSKRYMDAFIVNTNKNRRIFRLGIRLEQDIASGIYTLKYRAEGYNATNAIWLKEWIYTFTDNFEDIKAFIEKWRYNVVVIEDTDITFYTNSPYTYTFEEQVVTYSSGSKTALSYPSNTNLSGSFYFSIGGLPTGFWAWDWASVYQKHRIDELCLFKNTELNEAQVLELYNNSVPLNLSGHSQASNLWCWYRFGDHASDNFVASDADGCYDASGQGNHLEVGSFWNAGCNMSDGDVPNET